MHLAECTAARNGPMRDITQPCQSLSQGRMGPHAVVATHPFRPSAGREPSSTCAVRRTLARALGSEIWGGRAKSDDTQAAASQTPVRGCRRGCDSHAAAVGRQYRSCTIDVHHTIIDGASIGVRAERRCWARAGAPTDKRQESIDMG